MNYKHLHYFWTVLRTGGIVRASEQLHLTPQTLSGQIKQLEERVGQPLLRKVGRGVEPTDAGRLVMRYADEIFALGASLQEALATGRYDSEAVALTDISICRIPVPVINTLGGSSERLHRRLMEKWQHALREADDWLADLNFGTARQRVAHFVLKMRNPDNAEIVTLFSREDMGAMLDIKLETVSREVSALVRENLIEPLDKQGRCYRVLDLPKLLAI